MAAAAARRGNQQCLSENINIRPVWAENLEEEFALMGAAVPYYPIITLDTEFPRATHTSTIDYRRRTVKLRYKLLRDNVAVHDLTQLGITLSDASGRLPKEGVWEFNFRQFDFKRECHNPATLALLQGKRVLQPIDYAVFSEMLKSAGLVCNEWTSWFVFGGAYDIGYLLKILLNGGPLPSTLQEFERKVEYFFGQWVFDTKNLASVYAIIDDRVGLEELADILGVERVSGRAHNAGSDSLLTSHVFHTMKERLPVGWEEKHCGEICGIQVI